MSTRSSLGVVGVILFAALVASLGGCASEEEDVFTLSPSSLQLSAQAGQLSAPVRLVVDHGRHSYSFGTNDAAGELATWVSYEFPEEEDEEDFSVSRFDVYASAEELAPGTYTAKTTFESYGKSNLMRELPIVLTVLPATTGAVR